MVIRINKKVLPEIIELNILGKTCDLCGKYFVIIYDEKTTEPKCSHCLSDITKEVV